MFWLDYGVQGMSAKLVVRKEGVHIVAIAEHISIWVPDEEEK